MLHQRKWQTNTPCWRSGRIADGDIFHPDLPMVFWGGRPTVFGDPSAKSTRQWSWKPWCCATSFHILTLQCLWKPMGLSLRLVVQTHLETRERMKWHVKSKLVGPGKNHCHCDLLATESTEHSPNDGSRNVCWTLNWTPGTSAARSVKSTGLSWDRYHFDSVHSSLFEGAPIMNQLTWSKNYVQNYRRIATQCTAQLSH